MSVTYFAKSDRKTTVFVCYLVIGGESRSGRQTRLRVLPIATSTLKSLTMRSESRECVNRTTSAAVIKQIKKHVPYLGVHRCNWRQSGHDVLCPCLKSSVKSCRSSLGLSPLPYWSVKGVLTSASKFPPLAKHTCIVNLFVACYHYCVITTSVALLFFSKYF